MIFFACPKKAHANFTLAVARRGIVSNCSGKETGATMRIILIDDELNIRRNVVPVLKGMGHDVVEAHDGAEGKR